MDENVYTPAMLMDWYLPIAPKFFKLNCAFMNMWIAAALILEHPEGKHVVG